MLRPMKRAIPTEVKELNGEMGYHGITVTELSAKAKVGLSDTSRILNGWLRHPEKFAKLRAALDKLKGAAV